MAATALDFATFLLFWNGSDCFQGSFERQIASDFDKVLSHQLDDFVFFILDVVAFVPQAPNFLLQSADSLPESFLDGALVQRLHELLDHVFVDAAIIAVTGEHG